ncbi:MAG: hypothetical protein B7X11_05075 [Acidobacteria bacterium 37-65-4]|nr:MAG: hypothetical protein B7X11_05075 [Acidobacteria bacterium 37-65-4]
MNFSSTIIFALLIMLLALNGACANALLAASANDREERVFTLEPGGVFSLDNVNGDITVQASEGKQVKVVALKRAKAMDQAKAQAALLKVKVLIESSPSEISVKTSYPNAREGLLNLGAWVSVDYTVMVPGGTALKLSGVNGTVNVTVPASVVLCEVTNGSIRVEGASLLTATTVNGSIRFAVENIREVTSTNGAIEGSVLSVKPSAGKVETVNGSITLSLAKAAAARIEAENVNGSIRNDLPGLNEEKHSLSGDLNGGGFALSVETVNGAIEITGSGDRVIR